MFCFNRGEFSKAVKLPLALPQCGEQLGRGVRRFLGAGGLLFILEA